MTVVCASVVLENALDAGEARCCRLEAAADNNAYMMVIPEAVRQQLGLRLAYTRAVTDSNGAQHEVPVAGPLCVRFQNRMATCNAFVVPEGGVVLGRIPLGELDVVLDRATGRLQVNPESPDMATLPVMGAKHRHSRMEQ